MTLGLHRISALLILGCSGASLAQIQGQMIPLTENKTLVFQACAGQAKSSRCYDRTDLFEKNLGFDAIEYLQLHVAIGPGFFGDLEVNHWLLWKWRESIAVFDNGSIIQLDQTKLAKYPNLLARLNELRPSFKRVHIMIMTHAAGYRGWAKLSFDEVHFLIPKSGSDPYSPVPYSPNWGDVTSWGGGDLREYWRKRMTSAQVGKIEFEGWQLPIDGLAKLAKDLQELEKLETEAQRKADTLRKELDQDKSSIEPAYPPSSNLSEPFEGQATYQEYDDYGARLRGIKTKSGKVVFSWPDSEVASVNVSRYKSRLFSICKRGKRTNNCSIHDAKGATLSIGGVRGFTNVSFGPKAIEAVHVVRWDKLENSDFECRTSFASSCRNCMFNTFFDKFSSQAEAVRNYLKKTRGCASENRSIDDIDFVGFGVIFERETIEADLSGRPISTKKWFTVEAFSQEKYQSL